MSSETIVRGVLFDMDGVIIDSLEEVERFWIPRLAQKGIALSEQDFLEKLHGRPAREVIEEYYEDASKQEREKLHQQVEQFDREHEIRLISGVENLLRSLKQNGVSVGLVTSALPSKVENTYKVLDNDGYFSSVVTSVDVNEGKPHPECYQKAAQALGLGAEECVVFEDSVNGIRSADAAGAYVVGVNKLIFADLLKEQGARTVIPDFEKAGLERVEESVFGMYLKGKGHEPIHLNTG